MRKADNLPPHCAVVKKSRSLNFLDPSGPPMACYGSALPLLLRITSNVGVILKKELERVWREAVVAYLYNVISLSVTGVSEGNHEKSKKPDGRYFGRKRDLGACRIQVTIFFIGTKFLLMWVVASNG